MSLLFTAHLLTSWDQTGHGAPKIFRGALVRRGAQFGNHCLRPFMTVKLGACYKDGNCWWAVSYACQVLLQLMFGGSLTGLFTSSF
jgi:hypothetical protein